MVYEGNRICYRNEDMLDTIWQTPYYMTKPYFLAKAPVFNLKMIKIKRINNKMKFHLSLTPQDHINTEYPFFIMESAVTAVLLRGMQHSLQTDAFTCLLSGAVLSPASIAFSRRLDSTEHRSVSETGSSLGRSISKESGMSCSRYSAAK